MVSAACTSQSHVCPISVGPPVRPGSAANAVHSSGSPGRAASRALAAQMISVRRLIASTSSSVTAAPSAIPRSSSRYFAPWAAIGARKPSASARTRAGSQPAAWANTSS